MQAPSNRMGTERIPILVLKLGLPIMLSMALEALYNIIDSLYVSRLGNGPIAALSLAYPIQQLVVALTGGLGLGASGAISRRLGRGEQREANEAGNTALGMSLGISLLFLVFGGPLVGAYVRFFTDDPSLADFSLTYIGISIVLCGFQVTGGVITFMLQGTGESLHTLLCLAVGVVCNLILDPILMFGLDMEVAGAAWASIIGQAASCAIATVLLVRSDKLSCLQRGQRIWRKSAAGTILAIGVPTMLLQASGSISLTLVNKILIGFTPLAVTAYGLYIKVESFIFLPMHGMSNSLVPITSFNYGANRIDRTRSAYRWSLCFTYLYMLGFGFPLFQIHPEWLYGMFRPSAELARQMEIAFPRVSLCFIGAPLLYQSAAYLQGFGKGMRAALITLSRQVLGVLPAAYLLAHCIGLSGVWYCYFFGDLVGQATAIILLVRLHKELNIHNGAVAKTDTASSLSARRSPR